MLSNDRQNKNSPRLTQLDSLFNKQIDNNCNELINVFKKHSVDIVSAISLDR